MDILAVGIIRCGSQPVGSEPQEGRGLRTTGVAICGWRLVRLLNICVAIVCVRVCMCGGEGKKKEPCGIGIWKSILLAGIPWRLFKLNHKQH